MVVVPTDSLYITNVALSTCAYQHTLVLLCFALCSANEHKEKEAEVETSTMQHLFILSDCYYWYFRETISHVYVDSNIPTSDLFLNKTIFHWQCLHQLFIYYSIVRWTTHTAILFCDARQCDVKQVAISVRVANAAKTPIGRFSVMKVYPCLHNATKIGILHVSYSDYCLFPVFGLRSSKTVLLLSM